MSVCLHVRDGWAAGGEFHCHGGQSRLSLEILAGSSLLTNGRDGLPIKTKQRV